MTPNHRTAPVLASGSSDLDKVDMMRKLGLQSMISLPQIAVVGDQSSGKSSLLEYISGISFPKDTGMCTSFATEVSMRPASEFSAKVLINNRPDPRLSGGPRSPEEVAGTIQEAKKLFVEARGEKGIYEDRLTVELSGPGLPILTLVDLPGYIHTHSIGQPASIVQEIETLVEGYLHSPRTVIMAVIPVNRDFETNVAIKHIRRFDPEGKRTLCVLTKPDQVDLGTERAVLDILAGKKMHFSRGYHIIKNKNYEECQAADSRETTERKETLFFSRPPWSSISPTKKGIGSLVDRLSETLNAHVAREFLGMRKEILKTRADLLTQLHNLGPLVGSDLEKSNLLQKNLIRVMQHIKYLVDGHYSAGHFPRKYYIRARVRQLNRDFYNRIQSLTTARVKSLRVGKIVRESRGREIGGMAEYEAFVILSRQVIGEWKGPTGEHMGAICGMVGRIWGRVVGRECDEMLREYLTERFAEFVALQQQLIQRDAAELFDDELTPLTCQEFSVPSFFPDPTAPTVPAPQPSGRAFVARRPAEPEVLCSFPTPVIHPIRMSPPAPLCQAEYVSEPPRWDVDGHPANGSSTEERCSAAETQEEPRRAGGGNSSGATEAYETGTDTSGDEEEEEEEGPREPDTASEARLRWFVQKYCSAAATRYVDAVCLYVLERRLFKNLNRRVFDWVLDDKNALAHINELPRTAALRLLLPRKITELDQALVVLDK